MPDYSASDSVSIDFSKSVLGQNFKENIQLWRLNKGEFEKSAVQAPFYASFKAGFSYEIDLSKSTHIPSKAYLNYGSLQIANWQEILFDSDKDFDVNIVFVKDTNRYELGQKKLSESKANPSKIIPAKLLLNLNQISVYANLATNEVKAQLEKTLKHFNYLDEGMELALIFANDSFATGGISYDKMAIVYIDAKTSDSNPKFALQQTVLHELFHKISPYKIRPEKEAYLLDKNWLAEATPEYLALHYQLKNALITEADFIAQMEQKLRLADKFSGKSLNEMSLEVYRNANYYEAFYAKGCIALFLLDLKLYQESEGDISVINLILGNFPELNEERQLYITNLMHDQEQALIYHEGSFAMNEYLAPFVWLYQKQIVLPFTNGSETAEIRRENIIPNKMADAEQKSLWEGFSSKNK